MSLLYSLAYVKQLSKQYVVIFNGVFAVHTIARKCNLGKNHIQYSSEAKGKKSSGNCFPGYNLDFHFKLSRSQLLNKLDLCSNLQAKRRLARDTCRKANFLDANER